MSKRLQIHKHINSMANSLVANQSKLLNKNRKLLVSHPPLIQPKLTINQPEDEYEREAEKKAEQIMRMPEPVLQRKCTKCEDEESKLSQASESTKRVPIQNQDVPFSVLEVLQSSGEPLDSATRTFMEPRFGHDFSKVRVHSGAAAEKSTQAINALAYTVGCDIAFGKGQFSPGTIEGQRLIAHELTHIVQQSGVEETGAGKKRDLTFTSAARRIQRKNDIKSDPVLELKQVGAVWHLTLRGFTEAGAVAGYIWHSRGPPKGVRIVPLVVVEEPVQIGLFELSGITLEALKTMDPLFESWFTVAGISWAPDDLKAMLNACDGGLGIWAKAKAANKGKDPKITLGKASFTDSLTGEITLDSTTDKCKAVQSLIHELSNLSALSELDKVDILATAGELSRNEFIKRVEEIEYKIGVKNVLTAYNACKDKWLCQTNIMEFAAKAKDFEDYFKNLVSPSHKEDYGKQWDDKYRVPYEKKHPK